MANIGDVPQEVLLQIIFGALLRRNPNGLPDAHGLGDNDMVVLFDVLVSLLGVNTGWRRLLSSSDVLVSLLSHGRNAVFIPPVVNQQSLPSSLFSLLAPGPFHVLVLFSTYTPPPSADLLRARIMGYCQTEGKVAPCFTQSFGPMSHLRLGWALSSRPHAEEPSQAREPLVFGQKRKRRASLEEGAPLTKRTTHTGASKPGRASLGQHVSPLAVLVLGNPGQDVVDAANTAAAADRGKGIHGLHAAVDASELDRLRVVEDELGLGVRGLFVDGHNNDRGFEPGTIADALHNLSRLRVLFLARSSMKAAATTPLALIATSGDYARLCQALRGLTSLTLHDVTLPSRATPWHALLLIGRTLEELRVTGDAGLTPDDVLVFFAHLINAFTSTVVSKHVTAVMAAHVVPRTFCVNASRQFPTSDSDTVRRCLEDGRFRFLLENMNPNLRCLDVSVRAQPGEHSTAVESVFRTATRALSLPGLKRLAIRPVAAVSSSASTAWSDDTLSEQLSLLAVTSEDRRVQPLELICIPAFRGGLSPSLVSALLRMTPMAVVEIGALPSSGASLLPLLQGATSGAVAVSVDPAVAEARASLLQAVRSVETKTLAMRMPPFATWIVSFRSRDSGMSIANLRVDCDAAGTRTSCILLDSGASGARP